MARKKKATDYLLYTIMLLLVAGLMGIGTRQFTTGPTALATVGDRSVTMDDYARALRGKLAQYSAQLNQPLTLETSRLFGVPQQALGEILLQAALDDEDDLIGISVSDQRVANEVRAERGFMNSEGKFDPALYTSTLKQLNLKKSEFENKIRDEIARRILQTGVAAGIAAPEGATRAFLDYALASRDVSILRLGPQTLPDPVAPPTDDDLQSYFADHGADYTVPETRHITYVTLTAEILAPGIEIDDADLRRIFEARADQYNTPERRLVERLVFLDQASADAALARLASGEATFEALVAERGLTLADVDLGDVTKSSLGPAGDGVFAVAEAGATVVAPTDLGPAIFRVNAILAPQSTAFESVRDALRREEALKRASGEVATLSGEIDDLLAGGATLEDVAKETAAELRTIAYSTDSAEPIATDSKFRAAALAAKAGDFPEVLDDDTGGVFALRLESTDPERPQTFDEARDAVGAAWTAERTAEAMRAQAEAVAAGVRNGADMATQPGLFSTLKAQTRTSVGEGLTPEGLDAVFEMAEGDVRVVGDMNAAYVIRLDALHSPDLTNEAVAAQKKSLAADVSASIGRDIFALYTRALQDKIGVTLNQAAVNAVEAGFQ